MEIVYLTILFFITAVVYSSIGFGGGSTYTALLATAGFDFRWIRFLSLLCNSLVTGGNIIRYYNAGIKAFVSFWPFLLVSVPAAYVGGLIEMSQRNYMLILGFSLVLASVMIIFDRQQKLSTFEMGERSQKVLISFLSLIFGLLSGLVGIGGGVFLAPVLHLINWDNPKQIAAISSLFIFVNSLAGLAGHLQQMNDFPSINYIFLLSLAVMVGGFLGSKISVNILSPKAVKIGTGILVGIIGVRLILS